MLLVKMRDAWTENGVKSAYEYIEQGKAVKTIYICSMI